MINSYYFKKNKHIPVIIVLKKNLLSFSKHLHVKTLVGQAVPFVLIQFVYRKSIFIQTFIVEFFIGIKEFNNQSVYNAPPPPPPNRPPLSSSRPFSYRPNLPLDFISRKLAFDDDSTTAIDSTSAIERTRLFLISLGAVFVDVDQNVVNCTLSCGAVAAALGGTAAS